MGIFGGFNKYFWGRGSGVDMLDVNLHTPMTLSRSPPSHHGVSR